MPSLVGGSRLGWNPGPRSRWGKKLEGLERIEGGELKGGEMMASVSLGWCVAPAKDVGCLHFGLAFFLGGQRCRAPWRDRHVMKRTCLSAACEGCAHALSFALPYTLLRVWWKNTLGVKAGGASVARFPMTARLRVRGRSARPPWRAIVKAGDHHLPFPLRSFGLL